MDLGKIRAFFKNRGADFKRVNLLGYGGTMKALSKVLSQNGVPCDIYDDKFSEISHDEFGNRLLPSGEMAKNCANFTERLATSAEVSLDNFVGFQARKHEIEQEVHRVLECEESRESAKETNALSIISPGIPPFNALAQNAPNLISEYDFFAPIMPRNVWISGTNGKTTTTQMTTLLLRDLGAQSGGNIGIPLCDLDCDLRESSGESGADLGKSNQSKHDSKQDSPLWILETSSFMLHYTNLAKPDIYALLPITDDHISWHGDFESYVNAKLKPLAMMGADSSAIIPQIYAHSSQVKALQGKLYLYKDAESLANLFGVEANRLKFKGAFLLDSILSLAIASLFTGKIDYDLINSFQIDSHKVQEFMDAKGRVFVDDSKATNISAVEEALKIYADKFIFLILGGDNKGVSLAPLVRILTNYRVKIFAIGVSAEHIKELCDESRLNCEVCGDLQTAMSKIKREFKDTQNEICLLSPACASLDQFKSYAERGDIFKKYALSI